MHDRQLARTLKDAALVAGFLVITLFVDYGWANGPTKKLVVNDGRLTGLTRPVVTVKLAPTNSSTAPATNVAVAATFDTGADVFQLLPGSSAALGIASGPRDVNVGGISNIKGNTITEDALLTFSSLNLNAAMTTLAAGQASAVTINASGPFVAFGSDGMINGLVAIYDPASATTKTIDVAGNAANRVPGSEVVLLPALVGGNTNPAIAQTFNPAFKLPVNLTAFNGRGVRPTVTGSAKDAKGNGTGNVEVLWDTGAPTSQIDRDLLKPFGGPLDVRLSSDGTRAFIPELTFRSAGVEMTVKNLQVTVDDRPDATVPIRLGMNVLGEFKVLADLNDDPNTQGPDRFFGLQRVGITIFDYVKQGKVTEYADPGSNVFVEYTDRNGFALIDANGITRTDSKTVGVTGKVEFVAPREASDFRQFTVTPTGARSNLRVAAVTPRPAGPSGTRELGMPEEVLSAGYDAENIWRAGERDASLNAREITLPDLFLDSNGDGAYDSTDDELFAAVDLGAYLAGLANPKFAFLGNTLDRQGYQWRGSPYDDFLIRNGLAYFLDPLDASGQSLLLGNDLLPIALPGFVFGYSEMEYDPLALQGESIFINGDSINDAVVARALANHGLTVPEPSTIALLLAAIGCLPMAGRRGRRC